ncbi:MAG: hypothetical protein Q7U97_17530 [Rhodocyclaceae bacterium]|nr:hypothetical protein [Rhodocyclaceae bacterium]
MFQLVAQRRPAAGAPSLADVLGHAAEALFLRDHAVQLVGCAHYLRNEYVHHRPGLGELGVDDFYPALLALVVENGGDILVVARDPSRIHDQQVIPAPVSALQAAQQALETWPHFVVGTLDGVLKGLNDSQIAGLGEIQQLPALGVRAHVVAVLRAAQVEGGAVHAVPIWK